MSDRISRLLVPGAMDEPFEYETRKKGVGIVPEVKAKKSKLEGKETKKIDVAEPFGKITGEDFKKLKKASTGDFMTSRGGRAAICGTKFKGVF